MNGMSYRVFPDGTIVHEDDFSESESKYDDYLEVFVSDELYDYIVENY